MPTDTAKADGSIIWIRDWTPVARYYHKRTSGGVAYAAGEIGPDYSLHLALNAAYADGNICVRVDPAPPGKYKITGNVNWSDGDAQSYRGPILQFAGERSQVQAATGQGVPVFSFNNQVLGAVRDLLLHGDGSGQATYDCQMVAQIFSCDRFEFYNTRLVGIGHERRLIHTRDGSSVIRKLRAEGCGGHYGGSADIRSELLRCDNWANFEIDDVQFTDLARLNGTSNWDKIGPLGFPRAGIYIGATTYPQTVYNAAGLPLIRRFRSDENSGYHQIRIDPTLGATAWAASTAYGFNGDEAYNSHVLNDGGKVYRCIAAGTSGSTGPTGTGSDILDGSVHWAYVGLGRIPAVLLDDCEVSLADSQFSQDAYSYGETKRALVRAKNVDQLLLKNRCWVGKTAVANWAIKATGTKVIRVEDPDFSHNDVLTVDVDSAADVLELVEPQMSLSKIVSAAKQTIITKGGLRSLPRYADAASLPAAGSVQPGSTAILNSTEKVVHTNAAGNAWYDAMGNAL